MSAAHLDPAHLADAGQAAASLFALDDDRAVPGTDYTVDLQGAVHGYDGAHTDAAPRPLFSLAPGLLKRPLYARLCRCWTTTPPKWACQSPHPQLSWRKKARSWMR